MTKGQLRKYARVVVTMGINLEPGQDVIIHINVDQHLFAEFLVEECYKKGARKVTVEFADDKITRHNYRYQSEETLSEVPEWVESKAKYSCEKLPCMIYVDSSDPAAFDGLDMSKVMRARQKTMKVLKKYRDQKENKYQWVIVALPSKAWAAQIFPDDNIQHAYSKLEDAIIKCTRIDGKDPVNDWEKHIEYLDNYSKKMNDYHFECLEYASSNGTKLRIRLNRYHVWLSARETTLLNRPFTANMPTEEVFTMPDRDGVDGVVVSTKPLSYNGNLIENFKIYFEKGIAVKVEAERGQEILEEIINTDEGSKHLGEVALVPYDSPINQTGILFYNTLFDENACCHLALGAGFANNMQDYEKYTLEELKARGLNDSINHVDFMIGSSDLTITGFTYDGKAVEVFKNGNWNI